ncbi:MAG: hypothetical protein WA228_06405, partial [Desulfobaccales bacterium]
KDDQQEDECRSLHIECPLFDWKIKCWSAKGLKDKRKNPIANLNCQGVFSGGGGAVATCFFSNIILLPDKPAKGNLPP